MSVSVVAGPRNHRYRHSRHGGVGLCLFVSVSGPFEDGAEVAVQRSAHLAAPGAGREHDAVDQAADGGSGFVAFARVVQGVGETRHLAPVNAGDVRVDVGDVGRHTREACIQFVLACFEFAQSVHHAPDVTAVLDHRDHRCDLLLDIRQLLPVVCAGRTACAVEPVGFLGIGPDRFGRLLRCRPASTRSSRTVRAMPRPLAQLPVMTWLEQP